VGDLRLEFDPCKIPTQQQLPSYLSKENRIQRQCEFTESTGLERWTVIMVVCWERPGGDAYCVIRNEIMREFLVDVWLG